MKCLLFTLILVRVDLVYAILDNYHCGVGSISKVLSYGSSYFCGREKLNSCCSSHDECYYYNCENSERGYRNCDSQFESCIRQAYGFICGGWLRFTHLTPVRAFGSIYRSFSDFTPSCRKSGWEQSGHETWSPIVTQRTTQTARTTRSTTTTTTTTTTVPATVASTRGAWWYSDSSSYWNRDGRYKGNRIGGRFERPQVRMNSWTQRELPAPFADSLFDGSGFGSGAEIDE